MILLGNGLAAGWPELVMDREVFKAHRSLTRFSNTNFEAMIVSEGVREMPAAHPPEFRRRALYLVAQGNPVAQRSSSTHSRWPGGDGVPTLAPWSMRTEERNTPAGSSDTGSVRPGSSDRWAESRRQLTTH